MGSFHLVIFATTCVSWLCALLLLGAGGYALFAQRLAGLAVIAAALCKVVGSLLSMLPRSMEMIMYMEPWVANIVGAAGLCMSFLSLALLLAGVALLSKPLLAEATP